MSKRSVGVVRTLFILAAACITSGCSMWSDFTQILKTPDQLATEFGYVVMSRPVAFPFVDLEALLTTDVQPISMSNALAETAHFQSGAFRRLQAQAQATASAGVDVVALYQMLALMGGQALLPVQAGKAPAAPTAPLPTPDAAFASGALGQFSPATPYGPRIQTALHYVLLSRLNSAQVSLVKAKLKTHAVYVVFSQLTVVPGEKTRLDAAAELRTHWTLTKDAVPLEPKELQTALQVIPLFPTYNSVGELDDAAALRQLSGALALLLQSQAANVQSGGGALIQDVQRLVSATENVTLIGGALPKQSIAYRVTGVRRARPLEEWRPRGKTQLEPLTLPVVTIVLVDREKLEEPAITKLDVGMTYSSRWRRDRPWWDKLPPGTFIPGFWYDRGTSFSAPVDHDDRHPASWPSCWLPWAWRDCAAPVEFARAVPPAWRYENVVHIPEVTQAARPEPLALEVTGAKKDPEITLTNALDQAVLLCGTGSPALQFLFDGIYVEARRIGDETKIGSGAKAADGGPPCSSGDTYVVLLPGEVVRAVAKSRGVVPEDCRNDAPLGTRCATRSVRGVAKISAWNAAGPATNAIDVKLALNQFYPAPPPPERLRVKRDDSGSGVVERDAGSIWPEGAMTGEKKK